VTGHRALPFRVPRFPILLLLLDKHNPLTPNTAQLAKETHAQRHSSSDPARSSYLLGGHCGGGLFVEQHRLRRRRRTLHVASVWTWVDTVGSLLHTPTYLVLLVSGFGLACTVMGGSAFDQWRERGWLAIAR
jgi:hypothetical protein